MFYRRRAGSEKNGTVTNSERRISRQRSLLPPSGEAKPDWWIISEVAKRMGYEQAFTYDHPYEIFKEHAELSGFENNGSRAFDISQLQDLDLKSYDALKTTTVAGNRCCTLWHCAFICRR